MTPRFIRLKSVKETGTPNTYIATIDFELIDSDTGELLETHLDVDYGVTPEDTFGIAPDVRNAVEEWISQGNTPEPYTPPSPEEVRASMPPLTARQFRLGLVGNGISLDSVQEAINSIPSETDRAVAQVEWEFATSFVRTHPLISQIGAELSLSPEAIDAMWMAALDT